MPGHLYAGMGANRPEAVLEMGRTEGESLTYQLSAMLARSLLYCVDMKIRLVSKILVALAVVVLFAPAVSSAEDTLETKVKDQSSDTKTSVKKGVRHMKKGARKATGTDTPVKDAKDHLNDAGDDIQNTTHKLENKATEQK